MIGISIVTGISVRLLIFNQNQIVIAQQQKLQGMQNNQTSSSLTKQPLLDGNTFQMDNMIFSIVHLLLMVFKCTMLLEAMVTP